MEKVQKGMYVVIILTGVSYIFYIEYIEHICKRIVIERDHVIKIIRRNKKSQTHRSVSISIFNKYSVNNIVDPISIPKKLLKHTYNNP